MRGWRKLLCAGILGGSLILGNMAEAGVVTDRLPLTCYADHKVITYSSPGAKSVGYISANVDLIQITQVRGDGWCYGSYPGAGGKRVSHWFKITDVCADAGYTNRSANVKGKQTVYRTRSGGSTIGSVSNNEGVIVVADNGSRAQIVYRLDNGTGYKLGWVPSSSVQAPAPVQQSHNPQGYFDGVISSNSNQIRVTGWAFDRDNVNEQIRIHVYVGGPAGSGEGHEIRANKHRPDVGRAFSGVGDYHGFDDIITVNRTGNQEVYIYGINIGGGGNVEIGHKEVNIKNSIKGDINGNGKIDSDDLRLAKLIMLGKERYNPVADFNGDGKISAQDISTLLHSIENPSQERTGYIKTNGANLNFRQTPNGTILGKLSNGTSITVLQHPATNGWSKIRYNGREGYVASQYVVIGNLPQPVGENWDSKIGQKLADINTNNYKKPTNPFNKSYVSSKDKKYHDTNCTWYAFGRMREVTGKSISPRTNAGTWHKHYACDSNLTAQCVAERETSSGGHVVFVEYVDNAKGYVYFTEVNWNISDDYKVQRKTISDFKKNFKWFFH